MKEISVEDFKDVLQKEAGNKEIDFINVCTSGEYAEKHIAGVRSVPLDQLRDHVSDFSQKKTIYVHCQSGHRGGRAVEDLGRMGITAEAINVTGGLMAWDEAGFPTIALKRRLPLMRQTLLTAGACVVLGIALAYLVNINFIFISLFVGCGLMFAGITGWCGLSYLLEKMPWNT